jgi:threonine 3-dehydrogenase
MSVLIESGLDIAPVITHRFEAADYQQAFDVVRDGRCGKVILHWADR